MAHYEGPGVKETTSILKDAWAGMPTFKDVASSLGTDITNFGRGMSDKVADGLTNFTHTYDDSIVVTQGTRTLLGEDFASLYESVDEQTASSADGWSITELKGSASYGTEMMSANLSSSGSRRSLTTLQPAQRAAFEIVLLSKQHANLYSPGADASNDAVAQAYTDKMAKYRQYCESNGIQWQQVMQYASWELQTQSMEYADDAKGLYNPVQSETNRILSNRAHSMMLECAPDGWQDSLLPHLSGRITYEETLDTDRRSVGFLQNVGSWFVEKWDSVKNFVTSPWRAIKESVPDMIDAADTLIQKNEMIHQENMAIYQETGEEMKQKAEDTVDAAKEKAKELGDKADAYFGITEEGQSEERQAGE